MQRYIRNELYFALFLISAILAIVITRLVLELTGYPQLGSSVGLHIAHVLWGGLLMATAIFLLLAFISLPPVLMLSAIFGGVGFGLFIDEVGKFVTQDVNYFFKPAFVIMYVVFWILYLAYILIRHRTYTKEEYLLNALELTKHAAAQRLNFSGKTHASLYLSKSESNHPLVGILNDFYKDYVHVPKTPDFVEQTALWFDNLITKTWFGKVVTLFFIVEAVVLCSYAISALNTIDGPSFSETVTLLTLFAIGVCILYGAIKLRRSKEQAYTYFRLAIWLSITIVEVFRFYYNPFYGFLWLIWDIFLLSCLSVLIQHEKTKNLVDKLHPPAESGA